jgi:glycosyltransferase involved in cell wall biosynthesis
VDDNALVTQPEDRARVVALIPAYQEAARVATVVGRALAHLPVVVVDDGSTDGTAALAEAAGATVLRQMPNAGKGAALRTGFRWAIDNGFEGILTLDADGQHEPAEIPSFLAAWRSDASDLVVGKRNFRAMPPIRRLSNVVGGWAMSWAVGRPIPDNQSGFRLLSRRLAEAMLSSEESGFEFEVEMITRCIRAEWPIAWVPIRTIYAGEESHIRPWHHFRSFVRIVGKARREVRGR